MNNEIKKLRKVAPIFTSIFAVMIIGGLIYLKVNNYINVLWLIIGIVIALIAPVASWFTNIYLTNYTDKKYLDFEEETKMMLKYATSFKGYTTVDLDITDELHVELVEQDNNTHLDIDYDKEECIVNKQVINTNFITFGVTIFGLVIDKYGYISNVSGFIPSTTLTKKSLTFPKGENKDLKITNINLDNRIIYKACKTAESYIDEKNNIIVIGKLIKDKNDIIVNIYDNVRIVLNKDNFKAIYIKVNTNE